LYTIYVTLFIPDLFLLVVYKWQDWITEDMWDIKKVLERKGDSHTKVDIQSNSKLQNLTLSQSRGLGPSYLQINAQDAYHLWFGRSSYAWKDKEIIFPMQSVLWSTKIRVVHNCRNNIVFQNLPINVGQILPRSDMSGQRLDCVCRDRCKYPMVGHVRPNQKGRQI
jgi:hypothetical protein